MGDKFCSYSLCPSKQTSILLCIISLFIKHHIQTLSSHLQFISRTVISGYHPQSYFLLCGCFICCQLPFPSITPVFNVCAASQMSRYTQENILCHQYSTDISAPQTVARYTCISKHVNSLFIPLLPKRAYKLIFLQVHIDSLRD